MGNLILRSTKGSALTHTELDNNFGYFTGSHTITGSITASDGFAGNVVGTASYATLALTASYAISASYEINYEVSSSYAETASIATSASYAATASFVKNAQTASYVASAVSSSYASTGSYVKNAQTSSYVIITPLAAAPSGVGVEGEMIPAVVGGTSYLYVYINGGWKKTTLTT